MFNVTLSQSPGASGVQGGEMGSIFCGENVMGGRLLAADRILGPQGKILQRVIRKPLFFMLHDPRTKEAVYAGIDEDFYQSRHFAESAGRQVEGSGPTKYDDCGIRSRIALLTRWPRCRAANRRCSQLSSKRCAWSFANGEYRSMTCGVRRQPPFGTSRCRSPTGQPFRPPSQCMDIPVPSRGSFFRMLSTTGIATAMARKACATTCARTWKKPSGRCSPTNAATRSGPASAAPVILRMWTG